MSKIASLRTWPVERISGLTGWRPRTRWQGIDRGRLTLAAFPVLPGALTVFFSFRGGGFFADTPALVAAGMGFLLVLRITLADDPFAGFTRPLALTAAALGLYAVWTLISAATSDAPARAMIEFDRALLYWLALVLFGSLPTTGSRVAWAVRGLAAAIVVVCAAGLATRVLPDVWEIAPNLANERLSYPLTYWNALGVLAALGLVLCLHLTSSDREPVATRLIGAGALPIVATTLLFTFSRGGIAAAILALIAYPVLARPRAPLAGLLAAAPPVAVALVVAYRAELLAKEDITTPAAVAQGHRVALAVGLCVVAAVLLRLVLMRLDPTSVRRVARTRLRRVLANPLLLRLDRGRVHRALRWRARHPRYVHAGALAVVAVIALTTLDLPQRVGDQYEGFVKGNTLHDPSDVRGRLTKAGNNGRLGHWKVAVNVFTDAPLAGKGAGTFGWYWARQRHTTLTVVDAHSLYLETLAELGVVGLVLLLVALLVPIAGFAARIRGNDRPVYAALLAAALAWSVHAGIDWDWEMPAVTFWLFALAGMALAAPTRPLTGRGPKRFTRVALGAGCLALIVTPTLVAASQRQLNASVNAFRRGDCATAVDAALRSLGTVSVRPEPFQILGFCDVRLGRPQLGVEMLQNAVDRDPGSWDAYYGLALVRAAAGQDPRPAARTALRLNPVDQLARDGVRRFRTSDPRKWRRRAKIARLPIR